MPHNRPSDDERRRVFRRMEWVFVYLPPVLAVFVAVFGALFLAWLVPIGDLGFWQRWLVVVLGVLGIPLIAYALRAWWTRRH